jgi:hypothetical protein
MKLVTGYFKQMFLYVYLGTTVTNTHCIAGEGTSKLYSGKPWCRLVQKFFVFSSVWKRNDYNYKTDILGLRFVLCEGETWAFTWRVSENRIQRKIFGPKMEAVARGQVDLRSDDLNNLYSSPNIIRMIKPKMRWAGRVAQRWKCI